MKTIGLLLFSTIAVVGCNAQDVGTLGRIGEKLQARGKKLLLEEPNAKLVKTLPLLQSPNQPTVGGQKETPEAP